MSIKIAQTQCKNCIKYCRKEETPLELIKQLENCTKQGKIENLENIENTLEKAMQTYYI